MGLDQIHEQNNKIIKGSGGASDLLNKVCKVYFFLLFFLKTRFVPQLDNTKRIVPESVDALINNLEALGEKLTSLGLFTSPITKVKARNIFSSSLVKSYHLIWCLSGFLRPLGQHKGWFVLS